MAIQDLPPNEDEISGVEKFDILMDEIAEEDADEDGALPVVELETGIMFPIDPESKKYAAVVHRIKPQSITRHKDEQGDHVIRISIALTAGQLRDMYFAATGGMQDAPKAPPPIQLPPGVSAAGF